MTPEILVLVSATRYPLFYVPPTGSAGNAYVPVGMMCLQ